MKPKTRCTFKLWAVEFVNEYRSLISNATNIPSIQALVKQRKLALDGQDKDTSVFKYISKLEKCILQLVKQKREPQLQQLENPPPPTTTYAIIPTETSFLMTKNL